MVFDNTIILDILVDVFIDKLRGALCVSMQTIICHATFPCTHFYPCSIPLSLYSHSHSHSLARIFFAYSLCSDSITLRLEYNRIMAQRYTKWYLTLMRSKQYVQRPALKRVTSDLDESITSITNRMKVIFMSECAQSKQIPNHKQMLVNAKMT